ncbi:MAG: aminopeptidase [Planctomycetota bacterium]
MQDPRLDKLAKVLVHYSVNAKPGQIVRISGPPVASPAIAAIYAEVLRAGAHPVVRCAPEELQELFYELASDEQLSHVSPLLEQEVETIDASIGLWAESNTKALSAVDPAKQAKSSAARRPVMDRFMQRYADKQLKWVGTQYPTQASAQDAEMSLRQYADFVFAAGHLDKPDPAAEWAAIRDRQQKLADYLTGKKQIRFQSPNGTDLTVNVSDMKWVNCHGDCNFPDGEVFTGPNLDASDGGVNGTVRYSFPAVHNGNEAHGITLTFEKGRVTKATAEKGEDFLLKMLDQDEGARNLGEIAIGTNYAIQQYTKNTLFDEKIGGTFHAAVGAGYPETGNQNSSGLHWDMVCDLRSPENGGIEKVGGTITVDGEIISKDGRFMFDGWPGPI